LSGEIPQTRNAGAILLYRLLRGYGLEARGESGQAEAADHRTTGLRDEGGEKRQGALGEGREEAQNFEKDHFGISKDGSQAKLFVIGPKAHGEAELLDCPYRELRMPLARLENTRLSVHKRSLSAWGLIPLPSHRRIVRLLDDFRPDIIVCVMANTPWILTAERTARKLGIPLVLIVHDLNEEFEKVFPWARKALFEKNRQVYRVAARRLCVSPEMADFLEKRYGVPGEVVYPNRSEELQPRPLEMSLTLRAEVAAAEKLKN
jgi:hypothetical protein